VPSPQQTFDPHTAIVTASDSGIGKATAVALAQAGLDVGITWHSDSAGAEETAEEVRQHGRKAYVAQLDTADLDGCGAVIDSLIEQLGGCDVFVNNAGTGNSDLFVDMALEVSQGTGGRIIAVTSVHEHQPRVGSSAYDAAKHGLGGLVKTIALELGQYGITANAVAPGEIATPMTGQTDEDPHQAERPGIPLRRPGNAWEIADVIAFLASPKSGYVTGASWAVDGGMLQMGPQGGSHIESDKWREG
jgi:NAD(P)-dependent dehydrogenase (short-subunit alcohol dehydrogenase family)